MCFYSGARVRSFLKFESMKDKKEDHVFGVEEQMEIETFTSEFQLQKDRISNILDEAIYKLRLLVSP